MIALGVAYSHLWATNHYYNSWFFQLGFLVKKYPKVTSVKKPPCQYGQVILAMSGVTR
jgi:hypothetical protein